MSVIVKWSVFKRPKPPAESGWHLSRYYSPPPPTLPPTRPRCTPLTYTCHTQDITPVTSEKLNFVNTILYLSRTSELRTLMYVGGREYFFCMFVGLQCLVLTYSGLNNTPGPGPWHPSPPMTASTQIRRWHYCFLDHSYKWRSFVRSASLKIPNVSSQRNAGDNVVSKIIPWK